ncbi:MAG: SRPBCC family protein [Brooklawnia sp.]|jgi:uncharacterized protein YndB with AHSA1/START domain
MTFTPEAAKLVTREVRSGTRGGSPTRTTVARRVYNASQDDLWDALTNPERLPRWFAPVSGDLRLDGRYAIEGNASGRIEQCEVPDHFSLTWEFGGQVSWVSVQLASKAEGTELSIAHEGSVAEPEFWTQFGPGATGVGWDLALLGLNSHLAKDPAFDPTAAAQLATSPEAVAFIRAAALDWAEAGIADGDESVAARGAAERTVEFYTTVPGESH